MIYLFTDGACRGNPGPGGWACICVLDDRVTELGGAANPTTNNQMELTAMMKGLAFLKEKACRGDVCIYSDSKYVLQGMIQWRHSWKKRGWKNKEGEEVKNLSEWKQIDQLMNELSDRIHWQYFYIPGHAGYAANERADQIACCFADGMDAHLFSGSRRDYFVHFESRLEEISSFDPQKISFSRPKTEKVYYLSYVGGQVYRDQTWAQCSSRVQGTSGAKYKKIKSSKEEKEVLKKWGVKI